MIMGSLLEVDYTMDDKNQLVGFSLRLNKDQQMAIKLACISEPNLRYQYELFDKAIRWASTESTLNSLKEVEQSGPYKTYYIRDAMNEIKDLESKWRCNTTQAIHTAIVNYLYKEGRLGISF